jgi:hypothetical protein
MLTKFEKLLALYLNNHHFKFHALRFIQLLNIQYTIHNFHIYTEISLYDHFYISYISPIWYILQSALNLLKAYLCVTTVKEKEKNKSLS